MNNFVRLARQSLPPGFSWGGFDRDWGSETIEFFIRGSDEIHEGLFDSKKNEITWTNNTPQSLIDHFERILKLQSFQ